MKQGTEGVGTHVWLSQTFSRPPLELVSNSGERAPLIYGTDFNGSGSLIAREGWIAAKAHYHVIAIDRDDPTSCTRLPAAWQILPASDPNKILIRRYSTRGRASDGKYTIALVDRDAKVSRSVKASGPLVGQLADGRLVMSQHIVDWKGNEETFPGRTYAEVVVGGRFILTKTYLEDGRVWKLLDAETGDATEVAESVTPDDMSISPVYDTDTTSAVWIDNDGSALWLMRDSGLHRVDIREAPPKVYSWQTDVCWIDRDRVLLTLETGRSIMHIHTGARTPYSPLPTRAKPAVLISDSKSLDSVLAKASPTYRERHVAEATRRSWLARAREQLQSRANGRRRGNIQRPNGRGPQVYTSPISPAEYHLEIRKQREEMLALLQAHRMKNPEDLVQVMGRGIRIRTLRLEGEPALGASRLGGRPDLPKGMSWPFRETKPMMFLGQFRFDEVDAAMPGRLTNTEGLLLVFVESRWSFDDRGRGDDPVRFVIVNEPRLRRADWPDQLDQECRFEPAAAQLVPMLTPPTTGDVRKVRKRAPEDAAVSVGRVFQKWIGDSPLHQMFGTPYSLQQHGLAWFDWRSEFIMSFGPDALLAHNGFGDGGQLLVLCTLSRYRHRSPRDFHFELDTN